MKISRISALHYAKLVFRSLLFRAALAVYLLHAHGIPHPCKEIFRTPVVLAFIWIIFAVEMVLRFFPSRLESMGCQKQFARNYRPAKNVSKPTSTVRRVLLVLLVWCLLNGAIGALYFIGIIDGGILLLIALGYSICDMICILFFCPFQTWILGNKCCATCRIYNWDYAMMFTPFIFVPHFYTWSLLGIALLLVLVWELTAWRHPERFSDETNICLSCALCNERLCHHKVQLRAFLTANHSRLILRGNRVIDHALIRAGLRPKIDTQPKDTDISRESLCIPDENRK
ncbi:MAG: hypothetical protein J6S76_04545 [Clostridia bacterium]|nr:hypothetical protein [Clostridia bacterium]